MKNGEKSDLNDIPNIFVDSFLEISKKISSILNLLDEKNLNDMRISHIEKNIIPHVYELDKIDLNMIDFLQKIDFYGKQN